MRPTRLAAGTLSILLAALLASPAFAGATHDELRARVEAILQSHDEMHGADDASSRRELAALGPDALPILLAALEHETGKRLTLAIDALGDARHRPAIPSLRRHARGPEGVPIGRILRALARMGDSTVLADRLGDPWAMLPALASLGTPAALARLDARLRTSEPTRWYRPPAPGGDVITLPGLIVFADSLLGGDLDLWLAFRDSAGKAGPAYFVGGGRIVMSGRARPTLRGDVLELAPGDAEESAALGPSMSIRLAEVRADGDGDGLTDLVERRLRTDPASADTDGDGMRDAEDLVPASFDAPASDEDRIAMAIVGFLSRQRDGHGLMIVSYPRALPWPTRTGPVATVSGPDERALLDETGDYFEGGIQPISFERIDPVTPDERRYDVYGWGHSQIAVSVVEGRWYVTDAVALPFE